jgi:hypothetical protein
MYWITEELLFRQHLAQSEAQNFGPEEISGKATHLWPFDLCAAERTNFRTMDTVQVPQGTGSGFIWDRNGHVVSPCTMRLTAWQKLPQINVP